MVPVFAIPFARATRVALACVFICVSCIPLVAGGQIPSVMATNVGVFSLSGNYGAHDPSRIVKEGDTYTFFITGRGIGSKSSTDLHYWTNSGKVFPSGPPAWATNAVPGFNGDLWAPDVAYFNGKYHLYYSISQWGKIDSAIGLVTSPSLRNPKWTDEGKVIQSDDAGHKGPNTDTTSYNCIDPSGFIDKNGTVWLSFGSYFSGIGVTQLNPLTGKRLDTNTLVSTLVAHNSGGGAGSTIEASYLYQRGGYYYLFVNYGQCCAGVDSSYRIRVGRSTRVTGPYLDRKGVDLVKGGGTVFLESTGRYIGPGHASILDTNGISYLSYHYYDGNHKGVAMLGLAPVTWSADGWPAVVQSWNATYPFDVDARDALGVYDATLVNGAAITDDSERGRVLNLDGITNYVSLPISVANASTFATWVKWNGGADGQRIFDFSSGKGASLYLAASSEAGKLHFGIATGGRNREQGIDAPCALPTNCWVHVAVSLDGSAGVLYLNGSPVGTNNSLTIRPWQTMARNLYIGKSHISAAPLFSGRIDSFQIFGQPLSESEIRSLARRP